MRYKKAIVIFIIFYAFGFNSFLFGQISKTCDTVEIIAPAYLVLSDTSIHLHRDSTAIICEKHIVLTKKNGYALYSKLLGESQKHHLVDKMFQMLIASSTQDTMLLKKAIIEAEDAYTPYSGKVIRDIKIQVLEPFGSTISDTNLPVISTWGKALNKSHVSTHNSVINRKLLFKVNDTVDPFELVENTRELSQLPYLQDATIVVSNSVGDSVDILVLVKDKFPWVPSVQLYDFTRMSVYLKNVNIVGMGQSLGTGLTLDTKSEPVVYLSSVNYFVNNIYKQISGGFNFNVSDNAQLYQVVLNRNLIPLSVRLGGGLELSQTEQNIETDPTGVDNSVWFFKYNYIELWSNYLFYREKNKLQQKDEHTYIIPGVALTKRQYLYRPFVSKDSNSMFSNYTTILSNIAIANQYYYRVNYFMDFGKAEYLPYGFQFSLTGGYTWSELGNYPYFGIRLYGLKHIPSIGYLFADFDFGSHISDKLVQGAFAINMSYLTSLHKKGRYRYRLLSSVNYTTGINRLTNDLIYLGDSYGFIGLPNDTWYGQQRLFLEMDFITYTPWYLFGFRFAIFSFGSLGLIGSDDYTVLHNSVLSSVGVGIYMKNDFLAFNSFQVRVAYFPVTPSGISNFGISFSTFGLIKELNFLLSKPKIVNYQ